MSAVDDFGTFASGLEAPADKALAIAPSNGVDLEFATRAIYVGSGGDLRVEMQGGGLVTFVGVPGGTVLPVRVARVYATGTTATSLVGLR